MSAVIRWEEPPAEVLKRRPWLTRSSKLAPLADELRENPGAWALVYEGTSSGAASGMATHIRLGQVAAFTPTGDFDAVSQSGNGLARAWARYVGGDE